MQVSSRGGRFSMLRWLRCPDCSERLDSSSKTQVQGLSCSTFRVARVRQSRGEVRVGQRRNPKVIAAGIVVGLLTVGAVDVRATTLEEAMVLAYENNPTLEAARAELRATDEQIAQAKSLRRPTIDITGDAGP